MTKAELLELIANGVSSGVEFKRDDLRPEQIAKEVVALANLRGGRILLGVEDDGTIAGVRREGLKQWVMDTVFGRKVHPMILPFYEEVQNGGGGGRRVAAISLTQGTAKPYVVRHEEREDIYVRVGSTSRLATRKQQARLFALSEMLHAERLPVSGSGFADLGRERLEDYLTWIVSDDETPGSDETKGERACGLRFMAEWEGGRRSGPSRDCCCSDTGRDVCCAKRAWGWMAFEGRDKTYRALDGPRCRRAAGGAAEGGTGRREVVGNGLIDMLLDFMRPFVSEETAAVEAAMRRERRWLYPVEHSACQQSPERASFWTVRRPQHVGGQDWASSARASLEERARSRRQGRKPREAGAERSNAP